MSGVVLPPAPNPTEGGEGVSLQLGETQGDYLSDPTVPGPRTDGAAAEMVGGCQHRDRSPPRLRADGVKLGPAGPHLHRRMRERREMSLGKWFPPGVHSTMVQPDQGPHLVGLGHWVGWCGIACEWGVTDLDGKQWSALAPQDREYRHVRRPP